MNDEYRELVMRILGWFLVGIGVLAVVYFRFGPREAFFRDDQTRSEDLLFWLYWLAMSSVFIFGGAALLIYSKLCQIARQSRP
jgi:amino acid permease